MSESKPVGRPSKYKLEYCEMLIEHMSGGYSFESFAGTIRVNRDSLYEWEKVHPEFSDAKKVGVEASRLFWEAQGIDGLYSTTEYNEDGKPLKSKSINASIWIFNMKNRFRDQWHDKQQIEHSGHIADLPDEKLDEKLKELNAKFEKEN